MKIKNECSINQLYSWFSGLDDTPKHEVLTYMQITFLLSDKDYELGYRSERTLSLSPARIPDTSLPQMYCMPKECRYQLFALSG